MEVGRKKEINQLSKIYLSFMKAYLVINENTLVAVNLDAVMKSEVFLPQMIDDLKLAMELV